jgi:hypothetical protein
MSGYGTSATSSDVCVTSDMRATTDIKLMLPARLRTSEPTKALNLNFPITPLGLADEVIALSGAAVLRGHAV